MALRTPNTAQILIKSPVTSNGRDPILDANGQRTFKETIAMASARGTMEKINAKLPEHLKHIITDYTPDVQRAEEPDPAKRQEAPKVKNVTSNTDDKK